MRGMPQNRGKGPLRKKNAGGCWFFYLDGRRIHTPHRDKDAAETWRLEYLLGLARGERRERTEQKRLNDALDLVVNDYARSGKKSDGALASRLKRLRPGLGNVKLTAVDELTIESYVDERMDDEAAPRPSTVNRELEILRRALRLAQERRWTAWVPKVQMLREDNVRTQRITHEEYRRLAEALPRPERWIAVLAYHTGWRRERLLTLRWEQVDWERGVIYAPANQERHKWVGAAPIYGDMAEALREASERGSEGLVIRRANGAPVADFRKAWARARKMAGIAPDFRLHDMRACAASNLLDAGVSEERTCRIVGWTSTAMLRRYRIESAKGLREAGRLVENRLGQNQNRPENRPGDIVN